MNSVSCKIQKAIYPISGIFAEKRKKEKKMQSPLLKQRARNNNSNRKPFPGTEDAA